MGTCDVCGNQYAHAFQVTTAAGETFTFDAFECAIHRLAPRCAHCGVQIVGHGIEADGILYCCASCARAEGVTEAADNV